MITEDILKMEKGIINIAALQGLNTSQQILTQTAEEIILKIKDGISSNETKEVAEGVEYLMRAMRRKINKEEITGNPIVDMMLLDIKNINPDANFTAFINTKYRILYHIRRDLLNGYQLEKFDKYATEHGFMEEIENTNAMTGEFMMKYYMDCPVSEREKIYYLESVYVAMSQHEILASEFYIFKLPEFVHENAKEYAKLMVQGQ